MEHAYFAALRGLADLFANEGARESIHRLGSDLTDQLKPKAGKDFTAAINGGGNLSQCADNSGLGLKGGLVRRRGKDDKTTDRGVKNPLRLAVQRDHSAKCTTSHADLYKNAVSLAKLGDVDAWGVWDRCEAAQVPCVEVGLAAHSGPLTSRRLRCIAAVAVGDHLFQRHSPASELTNLLHEVKGNSVLLPLGNGSGSSSEVCSEKGRTSFFGFEPRGDVHGRSLERTKPSRQQISKRPLFSIAFMNDQARRTAFLARFAGAPCNGDREVLIRRSGLTKGRISQLFDPDQQFGERAASSLADRLGLPSNFFNAPAVGQQNVRPAPLGTTSIPLISRVQAGAWSEVTDPYQTGDASEWLVTDLPVSGSTFALEVQGDSMLPDFQPGDRIIVDPEVIPRPGDFVVAKNCDEEATFKKFRPRGVNEAGQQVFELVPLNPDYPSMRSDLTPVRIIGTMVEHRKYRKR